MAQSDQFNLEVEFDSILRMELNKVGVKQKVKALEQLAVDYAKDPGIAKVYLKIGSLLTANDPSQGFLPSPELSLYWTEKAALVAPPGSDTWVKAKFILIDHESPATARRLLDEVEANSKNDLSVLAKVELAKFYSDLDNRDIEAADKRRKQLLNWSSEKNRMPADLNKQVVHSIVQETAMMLMSYYSRAPIPIEQRKKKIAAIANCYPHDMVLFQHAERALKKSERRFRARQKSISTPVLF
jgi:hypothetical protein